MTQNTPQDEETDLALEALFAEAAEVSPLPPAALLARIEADAEAVQSSFAKDSARVERVPAWRRWLSEIGGAPALGGLAMSACVGAYIGFANPDFAVSVQELAGLESVPENDDPFSMPLLGDLEWINEG